MDFIFAGLTVDVKSIKMKLVYQQCFRWRLHSFHDI